MFYVLPTLSQYQIEVILLHQQLQGCTDDTADGVANISKTLGCGNLI